jgi:hypothetical protein
MMRAQVVLPTTGFNCLTRIKIVTAGHTVPSTVWVPGPKLGPN